MADQTTVTIYGASDDLVEVRGKVPGCDEHALYDSPGYVEMSTGDVFKVEYTDAGCWEVNQFTGPANSPIKVDKVPHPPGDDPEPYTDKVTITGPIVWVQFWDDWPVTDAMKVSALAQEYETTTAAEDALMWEVLMKKRGRR